MSKKPFFLPPRPDGIVTMLTSDDFLPGVQTMLYSVKKCLTNRSNYPPELVVMVTPNVSKETREALCPVYCTRIIEVEPISFHSGGEKKEEVATTTTTTTCHVENWSTAGALTKLHIFKLTVYDVILYIDADCLVVKDVSEMIQMGKSTKEGQEVSNGLVAAAPDIFPPDKFNAGVMIIRPNKDVFDDMMEQRSTLVSYDGGDTGFLNSYYSDWYTGMPSSARLKFGFNAQQFLYHCTYGKQPNYWDVCVAPDLHILHFSSSPKPWESSKASPADHEDLEDAKKRARKHLEAEDVETVNKVSKTKRLEELWWKWYEESKGHIKTYNNEQAESEERRKKILKTNRNFARLSPKEVHKLVAKRYKELRQEGKSSSDAMKISRREYKLDKEGPSAASQVATMFGMS